MIRSFTGWRYIFAVAIFMHHYQIDGKSVLQAGGVIGVTFFFILSGFLLAYGYKKRLMTREISTSDFYKARAVKLYPLHILCFAAVFLLGIRNFVTADLPKAVLNLFLLQSWVPSPDYYMSYNAVSWFLSDELFFYLMFPFVLPVLLNGSGKKIAVGVGIFAISYSAAAALIPSDHYHAYFYINPLSRFADFVFGILVFRIFDQRRQATVGHTSRAEAGAILLVFATFILFDHIPKPYHYCSVIFWGPVAMLIYIYSQTLRYQQITPPHTQNTLRIAQICGAPPKTRMPLQTGQGGIFSQGLSCRAIQLFGEASFCFYLIHQQAILFGRTLAAKAGLDTDNLLALLVFLVLTTLGSVACLKWIEQPAARWLKRKIA